MSLSPFNRLTEQIRALFSSQGLDATEWNIHCLPTRVWESSNAADGGLAELISAIVANSNLMIKPQPILVLGLLPATEVRRWVTGTFDRRQGLLLDWPGFAYLPYGFDKDEILATALRIVDGARMPLPEGIWPTVSDILRLTSEVRHWLKNRRRNVHGAQGDFESAGRGEIKLDSSYYEPVEAIPEAHRAMIGRMFALEALALLQAPRIGGMAGIRAALEGFKVRWADLESIRAELQRGELTPALYEAAAGAHQLVVEAMTEAIYRTDELDKEMTAGREE